MNTTPETSTLPILVLGATGKTGRRIVDRLTALGVPVRSGSRRAEPAFDWEDDATWPAALAGVRAVYISYYPDLAIPGAKEKVAALASLAVGAGVRRLVLLSGRGEHEAKLAEEAIQASGADWTILRCSFFNQNFSESFFAPGIAGGESVLPIALPGEPFVDADDIADAAVAALTDDRHIGELYELTGPRLLTFGAAVGEIAAATGREIRHVPVLISDYSDALTAEGVPSDVVELIEYLFTEVMDGRNEYVTDGVQRVLGRAPRDFADFARAEAAAGTWS